MTIVFSFRVSPWGLYTSRFTISDRFGGGGYIRAGVIFGRGLYKGFYSTVDQIFQTSTQFHTCVKAVYKLLTNIFSVFFLSPHVQSAYMKVLGICDIFLPTDAAERKPCEQLQHCLDQESSFRTRTGRASPPETNTCNVFGVR